MTLSKTKPESLANVLILGLGSNLGDRQTNLHRGQELLSKYVHIYEASRIYESAAVDYAKQPDFYNQVISCSIPKGSPEQFLTITKSIEAQLGPEKPFAKGPRYLDIDLLFWGTQYYSSNHLVIPHPEWRKRDFVLRPLQDLRCFESLKNFTKLKEQATLKGRCHPVGRLNHEF